MAGPMFSIVVVSLNAGDKLAETVESIRRQTFTDYEVIVKDGGSRDGSIEKLREVLADYPADMQKRIKVYTEKDSSIYDGMNQAVEKTTGAYLYFLNCGDYFYENRVLEQVAEQITAVAAETTTAAAETTTAAENDSRTAPRIFYGDIYDALRDSVVASNPKIDGFACYRNVPCHQACIYDRQLFARRGYNPEYRVRADYEHFLYSFFEEKAGICYIPVVLASYEGGGFSETAENRKKSEKEHREIVKKYMSLSQRFWYRSILVLTLAPLRTKIAESPKLGAFYQRIKGQIYGRKN